MAMAMGSDAFEWREVAEGLVAWEWTFGGEVGSGWKVKHSPVFESGGEGAVSRWRVRAEAGGEGGEGGGEGVCVCVVLVGTEDAEEDVVGLASLGARRAAAGAAFLKGERAPLGAKGAGEEGVHSGGEEEGGEGGDDPFAHWRVELGELRELVYPQMGVVRVTGPREGSGREYEAKMGCIYVAGEETGEALCCLRSDEVHSTRHGRGVTVVGVLRPYAMDALDHLLLRLPRSVQDLVVEAYRDCHRLATALLPWLLRPAGESLPGHIVALRATAEAPATRSASRGGDRAGRREKGQGGPKKETLTFYADLRVLRLESRVVDDLCGLSGAEEGPRQEIDLGESVSPASLLQIFCFYFCASPPDKDIAVDVKRLAELCCAADYLDLHDLLEHLDELMNDRLRERLGLLECVNFMAGLGQERSGVHTGYHASLQLGGKWRAVVSAYAVLCDLYGMKGLRKTEETLRQNNVAFTVTALREARVEMFGA